MACILLAAQLSLFSQAFISGYVLDKSGNPLEAATVQLVEPNRGVISDVDGYYEINGVRSGRYTFRVSYVGFETHEQVVTIGITDRKLNLVFALEKTAFSLDELTVRSTRANSKTPMTYENVRKEDLTRNNLGQDVPYVLQWTPSAVVTSDAGTGIGYTGLRIRGIDPTQINVTINGIPLNDAESQGVFWVDLPDFVSSANDVQIQRGVGSSTNGAGAFGATINLNSNSTSQEAYAQVNQTLGSFNTYKRNVQFGTGQLRNGFSFDGRLSKITSDGFIDRATADLSSYYTSAAYTDSKNLLRFNLFSGHERTYQAWNGIPEYLLTDSTRTLNTAGTDKPGEPYEDEVDDYTQTHYQLFYNRYLKERVNLNIALHYTKGAGYYEQYKADQKFVDYGLPAIRFADTIRISQTDLVRRLWLDNDFYGTVFSINGLPDASNNLEWTLGGGYHIYQGDHFGEVIWTKLALSDKPGQEYYRNDADKRDFNLYAKATKALGKSLFAYADVQYRMVNYTFLGLDDAARRVDQTIDLHFLNPKAGVLYQPDNHTEYYTSLAIAHREPNRNDYVESTPSSRPNPERLYNAEAGYRYRKGSNRLEANLYYMYYQNQLAVTGRLNDVGAYTRINVPKSYRAGVELTGQFNPLPKLQIMGSTTLSQNKVLAYTEYLDKYDIDFNWLDQGTIERKHTDLAFSASVLGNLGVGYQVMRTNDAKRSLVLSANTKYVGRQYLDNSSDKDNSLDPYTFTDFQAAFTLRPQWVESITLRAQINNLFNALYSSNGWSYRYSIIDAVVVDKGFYPQAGRHYMLALQVAL